MERQKTRKKMVCTVTNGLGIFIVVCFVNALWKASVTTIFHAAPRLNSLTCHSSMCILQLLGFLEVPVNFSIRYPKLTRVFYIHSPPACMFYAVPPFIRIV